MKNWVSLTILDTVLTADDHVYCRLKQQEIAYMTIPMHQVNRQQSGSRVALISTLSCFEKELFSILLVYVNVTLCLKV